ncbi:cyclic nucleotide-binding domain-containing protein [Candidatus Poribacteria bacterium]|nr:cyclic nucleotide-binding domain-containing protein [Candidatus Poribacteria bacterium]
MDDVFPQIQIFKDLNDSEINTVLEQSKRIQYKKDDVIFHEGDPEKYLHIILEGSVRISIFIKEIGEESLSILSSGEVFGEMAILDDNVHFAMGTAHEDCTLLLISRENFNFILDNYKTIANKILIELNKIFCARFKSTCENLKNYYLMDKMFR